MESCPAVQGSLGLVRKQGIDTFELTPVAIDHALGESCVPQLAAWASLPGRELIRNFRRRRDLGLLPGQKPFLVALPAEKRVALLHHADFGYGSVRCDDDADVAASLTIKARSAAVVELEDRKVMLEAQLVELADDLVGVRAETKEVGERIAEQQRAMGMAVDEHGALSKQLAEAEARSEELAHEEGRIRAALRERGSDTPNVQSAGAHVGSRSDHRHIESGSEVEDAPSVTPGKAVISEQLRLHRSYLLQLQADNQRLRERCVAAGVLKRD